MMARASPAGSRASMAKPALLTPVGAGRRRRAPAPGSDSGRGVGQGRQCRDPTAMSGSRYRRTRRQLRESSGNALGHERACCGPRKAPSTGSRCQGRSDASARSARRCLRQRALSGCGARLVGSGLLAARRRTRRAPPCARRRGCGSTAMARRMLCAPSQSSLAASTTIGNLRGQLPQCGSLARFSIARDVPALQVSRITDLRQRRLSHRQGPTQFGGMSRRMGENAMRLTSYTVDGREHYGAVGG